MSNRVQRHAPIVASVCDSPGKEWSLFREGRTLNASRKAGYRWRLTNDFPSLNLLSDPAMSRLQFHEINDVYISGIDCDRLALLLYLMTTASSANSSRFLDSASMMKRR